MQCNAQLQWKCFPLNMLEIHVLLSRQRAAQRVAALQHASYCSKATQCNAVVEMLF